MKIHFGQLYTEAGINFPFSWQFQVFLSKKISDLVIPSKKFIETYGKKFELMFRIDAKTGMQENEIRGPTVFKKDKDIEYTVFLPFDVIVRHRDAPKRALRFLLKGVCDVFDLLEIDKTKLLEQQDSLIDQICSDPTMLEERSWDDAENQTRVRKLFEAFFEK